MDDIEKAHAEAITTLARPGRVFVLGGVDSGKTTFTTRLAQAGLDAGLQVAVVDADLGQSTYGPPGRVRSARPSLLTVRRLISTRPASAARARASCSAWAR